MFLPVCGRLRGVHINAIAGPTTPEWFEELESGEQRGFHADMMRHLSEIAGSAFRKFQHTTKVKQYTTMHPHDTSASLQRAIDSALSASEPAHRLTGTVTVVGASEAHQLCSSVASGGIWWRLGAVMPGVAEETQQVNT